MTHEQMSTLAEIFRINNRAKWRLSYFEILKNEDNSSTVFVKYRLDENNEDEYFVFANGNNVRRPKNDDQI
jgi:hypothetical protein